MYHLYSTTIKITSTILFLSFQFFLTSLSHLQNQNSTSYKNNIDTSHAPTHTDQIPSTSHDVTAPQPGVPTPPVEPAPGPADNVPVTPAGVTPSDPAHRHPSPFIWNLSDWPLSQGQISLLNRGLGFCPTPGAKELSEEMVDLNEFHRKIRVKHHFHGQDEEDGTSPSQDREISENWANGSDNGGFAHQDFKPKSIWSTKGPPALEAFIHANETAMSLHRESRRPKDNITKDERRALKELKNLNNIVIKAADKGAAVVVMNLRDYVKEALRQLVDTNYYRPLPRSTTLVNHDIICTIVQTMYEAGEIGKKCYQFLTEVEPRTARFYLLPKIHKGKIPPPGRPIISGNGSPTERISQFVDYFIKEISPLGRSYVKDTTDFLRKLSHLQDIPNDALLVTLDVTSLYTNIPNQEGLDATFAALRRHRPDEDTPTNGSIIALLRCVLTMNNFEFAGKHYLQVGGTAMGTRAAPNFAILFMNSFEEQHVYTYHTQPYTWLRYI